MQARNFSEEWTLVMAKLRMDEYVGYIRATKVAHEVTLCKHCLSAFIDHYWINNLNSGLSMSLAAILMKRACKCLS